VSVLAEAARGIGIELTPAQMAAFDQFGAALREGNRRANLTSITDPREVEIKHFADSLTAALPVLERLKAGQALRLIDVGAGGGMPGLPLKIAFPSIRLTLLESVAKKTSFLRHALEVLQLLEVEVVQERAETAARDPRHRDTYDWATARALGRLPVVIELCAPFLAPGGLLVAQRKGDLEDEVARAAPAFKALKLWSRAPVPVRLPGLDDGRGLVIGEKYAPTPEEFPRRVGIPNKRPLVA
jgi:16S rRNA (guanine527-N7)-methyltransferase